MLDSPARTPPVRINTSRITHQKIEDEVVIIDLENGSYYSLRSFAAAIWDHVEAGRTRAGILDAVRTAYPRDEGAVQVTDSFLDQLLEEQLVLDEEPPGSSGPDGELPPVFRAPVLEKFTDMQELIMLDVIHEVDSRRGWPHKPSDS